MKYINTIITTLLQIFERLKYLHHRLRLIYNLYNNITNKQFFFLAHNLQCYFVNHKVWNDFTIKKIKLLSKKIYFKIHGRLEPLLPSIEYNPILNIIAIALGYYSFTRLQAGLLGQKKEKSSHPTSRKLNPDMPRVDGLMHATSYCGFWYCN